MIIRYHLIFFKLLANERNLIDLRQHNGKDRKNAPHGLTTDSDNNLYVAMMGGNNILRFNQNGQLDREIKLNTQQITNMCFGGRDNDTLFVTTAAQNICGQNQNMDAGYLHRITGLGARGDSDKNKGFNNNNNN